MKHPAAFLVYTDTEGCPAIAHGTPLGRGIVHFFFDFLLLLVRYAQRWRPLVVAMVKPSF
jgi:hypothetical protein